MSVLTGVCLKCVGRKNVRAPTKSDFIFLVSKFWRWAMKPNFFARWRCWMLDSGSEDFFRTEKKFGAKSLKYSVIRNFNGRKKSFKLWEAVNHYLKSLRSDLLDRLPPGDSLMITSLIETRNSSRISFPHKCLYAGITFILFP